MIVSIHQPNFFPWWPFFEKLSSADIFVVLGHCQYEKNGFQNRFNLDGNWYTMSTKRGLKPIVEKQYANHLEDWSKIKNRLPEYESVLKIFDDCISESLYETNFRIICKVSDILDINTKIVRDEPTMLTSTERLAQLCVTNGAKSYISGPSGKNYLEVDKFETVGVKVQFADAKDKRPLLKVLGDVV